MRARDWLGAGALPAWGLATAVHPRWRRDLAERWGLRWPPVQPGATWIHASSVGEIGAAAALLPHLEGPVLLTADTDTGAARARQVVEGWPEAVAGARPVDHPWALAPLWADARPRALVFVEGCYWPALAQRAHGAGIGVIRVSARAGRRTRRVPGAIYRRWAAATSLVLARDEEEAAWFRANQGAPVEIGGDLKLAGSLPTPCLRFVRRWVVGASTHPGEDEALLEAIPADHQLLLAPRDPRRAPQIVRAARDRGLRTARRSALTDQVPPELDVVVLDSLGELAGLLRGARAAFIGGTFDRAIGGHSPAEAAVAGVPVVAGPARWANRPAWEAATRIDVEDPSELGPALRRAISLVAAPLHTEIGARTAARILDFSGPPAPEAPPRPWAAPVVPILARVARRSGRPIPPPVPVVAVGSDNARGPGKTSTARWITARLAARGHRVGVVVHGVGRPGGSREVRLSSEVPAAQLGDEGALHLRDGHLVASGRDRRQAVRRLAQAGATVIVLDDGLHDQVWRHALGVRVIDARFPNARGPLPMGEARHASIRWDLVVAHHVRPGFPAPPGARLAHRSYGPWHRGERPHPLPSGPAFALCGLARGADLLEGLTVPIVGVHRLADHRRMDRSQVRGLLDRAGSRPILCTEKDWARLPEPLASQVWWRPLRLHIEGFPDALLPGLSVPPPPATR